MSRPLLAVVLVALSVTACGPSPEQVAREEALKSSIRPPRRWRQQANAPRLPPPRAM